MDKYAENKTKTKLLTDDDGYIMFDVNNKQEKTKDYFFEYKRDKRQFIHYNNGTDEFIKIDFIGKNGERKHLYITDKPSYNKSLKVYGSCWGS